MDGYPTTMSVRNMGQLLGLQKVDSYWLVHKGFFETILIGGKMRVVTESFEHWYAGQLKYRKVNGDPPGERLKKESYSAKDIAEKSLHIAADICVYTNHNVIVEET